MYYYLIPFIVYIVTIYFINNPYFLIARTALLTLLLLVFRKFYKLRFRIDLFSIFIGAIVFIVWILLEGHYTQFGEVSYTPQNNFVLFFRVFSFVVITPIIEEYFTRNFLARFLISKDWEKVSLGKFTPTSFIITVLFFGFSHNRWLPGLIAGALFNYLLYKQKNMESVIVAHLTSNALLAFYIVYTESWFLW